jgi:iron complex transport system substrate-binding protein
VPRTHPARRLLAAALLSALAATACGTASSPTEPAADGAGAATGAFPVSIEHRFGTTEIPAEPQRIVTVGLMEQDALLALGVVPVGTTEWFGEYPGAIHPWAQDELGSAPVPEVLSSESTEFERIAALDPDLILGLYAGLDQSTYDTLSRIAPTVAQPGEYVDYGVPWQDVTRTVGTAVGRGAEADRLVTATEADIAATAAEHPEFAGATALTVTPFEGYYVYGPQDPRSRFLADLGFEIPAAVGELTGEQFGAAVSREQIGLLDTDALVWLTEGDVGQDSIRSDPLYAGFEVVQQGRDIFVNDAAEPELYGATSFQSVLSIPVLLDGLVPRLSAAVDGDPGTPTGT